MSIHHAPPPIQAATERLRKAESQVYTLRSVVAHFVGASPARETARRELAACERALFNRQLELQELLRERRSQLPPQVPREGLPGH
jgi:hypothetical protein